MKLPYAEIEFTTAGTPADPAQVGAALDMLAREGATDVLIWSHGWNNDMAAARRLYASLADNVATLLPAGSARRPAVIGILWPSVRWADDDLIAGGGVSLDDGAADLVSAIRAAVDDPGIADRLLGHAGDLASPEGRAAFLAAARSLVVEGSDEDGPPEPLLRGDSEAVYEAVRVAVAEADGEVLVEPPADGGAPGVAPDLLAGAQASGAGLFGMSWSELARQVLNTTTYYTMKARAGDVGANGVAPLVDRINALDPDLRIHLAGHSFGARVVSAAATNITTPIESLTLLQGAFSHYGFTSDYQGTGRDGAFRGAIANGRIHGPLVITHTHNDRAVRVAYAIASRLAGQVGAGLGDRGDRYGGIGANGSLDTGAREATLGPVGTDYDLPAGSIHNLRADATISGHSDVTNPAVANAVAQAAGLL